MSYDIIIVGGGMVGQAFALSMAKTDYKIAIIEPNNPNPELQADYHTRVSAITPTSEKLLKNISAWDLIKRKHAFSHTSVWDQNSHGSLDFHAQDENLDHLGHIIENDVIQSALFSALEKTDVEFINAKVTTLEKTTTGYQVQLDNNTALACQLLIGADGARSRVRDLASIEFSENDYQQKAIVCNIKSLQGFKDTTWQRFLSDSIIALLPLSEHQASIVWSAENTLADELMQLSKEAFAKRLSAGVEYRFGEFELVSDIQAFPLIERSAKDYVQENLALIGDAAHNIHPLAGQGVNLGFSDIIELSQQLQSSSKPLGDYSTLRNYARARRLDNELMAKTMTGLNWIYKENNEPLRWLRGFGMNIINENPTLKSFLQKHALGNS
ncbi:2-octaprenyl-3-methyl-6-methoxy-1,4-benzoquinol hydroxylase [Candidatus Thioglobus autotrophicus]|uniref:2-octaprenyl-3-methyl-6-methoxy-1,4-benzoquinol hydroxylase n=1 Tax=Candidatus Thioglobus autotrophicus TaxID=1705394 RepID=A0A0M3TU48_9GAMM|nr:UbiH/UbiF/VisC/COQ6 family ubiquinone biosynthesis hydroxylase [Candidatus Thioglobus autotrophicus]ALE52315.1 2-octaprenyl-3-methyl-6-methoxy-1,4-benzoquinol hydroxylase [Candidatus Thioglobus autotrophicus]